MKTNLVITGVGMLTPVGLDALVSYHSVRSGITRLNLQPWPDKTSAWIVGGRTMTWTSEIRGQRLRVLAERALHEAWGQAVGREDPSCLEPATLFLGRPERVRPGFAFPPLQFDAVGWAHGLGMTQVTSGEVIEGGACSAQAALERAASLLDRGRARACVIGAVDSQLQLRVLRWHESNSRLKCSYVTDGLLPGEAACFFVVEAESAARTRGAGVLARIASCATANEASTILSDEPNRAIALTQACRTAIRDAGVDVRDLDAVWCDLNGESYRGREWAFTEVRLGADTATELVHPADCHGDLGTASDASLLAFAAMAETTDWTRGRPILVFSGSEGGRRAAAVLTPPPEDWPRVLRPVTHEEPALLEVDFDVPALGPDDVVWQETANPARTYFDWTLRQEHLEEIASLYYQRQALLCSAEIGWLRVREPERRLVAHLDAAVAGGPESVRAVASGIVSAEEGFAFAGALLLGVINSPNSLARIEEALAGNAANLAGVEAGLRHALVPGLERMIERWFDEGEERQRLAAALSGYRREGPPQRLLPLLEHHNPSLVRASVEACRRLRYRPAVPLLERLLATDHPDVADSVMLALFCLGSTLAPEHCRRMCAEDDPAAGVASFYLALYGRIADVDILLGGGPEHLTDLRRFEALGFLGSIRAVPPLIRALASMPDSSRPAVGAALERITGAGLTEEAPVPPDAEDGEVTVGQPRTVLRASTVQDTWSAWWAANGGRFDPTVRWRGGRPFELDTCLAELGNPTSKFRDRQRAYWELVIVSEHHIPFEPDWFVARQQRAIAQWRAWLNANPHSPGRGVR